MSWTFWLFFFLILIIAYLWLTRDSRNCEFVGLSPILEENKNVAINPSDPELSSPRAPRIVPCTIDPVNARIVETRIRDILGPHKNLLELYRDYNRKLTAKISFGEFLSRLTLETIFQREFPKAHPRFLESTKTSRCLELDCYCSELALACEYNGAQHYEFPNRYHDTEEEFLTQVANDRYKKTLCSAQGITLLIIPYTVPHGAIPEYLAKLLPPEYDSYRYDLVTS